MKNSILCLVLLGLMGCVSIEVDPPSVYRNTETKDPLTNIELVRVGMTYQEVQNVMGEGVFTGYEQVKPQSGSFEPMTIPAPFREEDIVSAGRTYHVVFYFTDVVASDGIVSEEELMPLVFIDDKLIGKGADFLFDLKK